MNTTIDIDSTEEINQPRFYTEKATYTQEPQCINLQLIYYECLIIHSDQEIQQAFTVKVTSCSLFCS